MKPTFQAVQNVREQAAGVHNVSRWLYWIAVPLSGGVGWIVTNLINIPFQALTWLISCTCRL
ncbi:MULTISPECIES: hypothetical protein [unclassified Bradyrhizobium]|uniref:hypothetical protein n=1 Tax=unclassified Bradyrhizobium TaxID=2631580 RepID=UPI000400A832|nr:MULTISPECIES: hypothetical protein [unclassified Bradyrhizobium]